MHFDSDLHVVLEKTSYENIQSVDKFILFTLAITGRRLPRPVITVVGS